MVDGAGSRLEVDAFVGNGVGDHHVELGLRLALGLAVELLGDALAVGRVGCHLGVEHADPVGRDPRVHQCHLHPAVGGDVVHEHDVATRPVRQHALGQRVELRRAGVAHLIGGLPTVPGVELAVDGDERHAGEQPEDLGLVARVVGLERGLDLADVAVVLGVLGRVHIDLDHLDLRFRELQPYVLGGLELAVAQDGVAQLVQVLEPDDGAALLDFHRGGHDGLDLDAKVAIDELLGVADAHPPPRLGIDVLDEVVELQRAVLGRGRGQEHDASAAGPLADGRAPEVELPRALAAIARVPHEAGDAALAVLGQVQVLVVLETM